MTLHYLQGNDFYLGQGDRGNILCIQRPGVFLVMFHSQNCQHCRAFMPEFRSMPGSIRGVEFALVDIDLSQDIMAMFANSVMPIQHVPHFVLFVDGIPKSYYKGERTAYGIASFINRTLDRLNRQETFFAQPPQDTGRRRRRPRREEPDPSGMSTQGLPRGRNQPRNDPLDDGRERYGQTFETSEYAAYEDAYDGVEAGLDSIRRE